MKKLSNSFGFSLVEIAVVLIIISSVVGVSISTGDTALKVADISANKNNLSIIRDSLNLFREKQGRYPCPAVGSDSPSDASYGKEALGCYSSCPVGLVCPIAKTSVIGVLPYKDLGLNNEVAFDSEGNKITYVVDKNHTLSSMYEVGLITVQDKAGNNMLQSPVLGDAIFVLINHGEDGNGAWSKSGSSQKACGTTSLDIENCDNDDVFMSAPLNESEIAAKYYDDFMLWYSQDKVDDKTKYLNSLDSYNYLSVGEYHSCAIQNDNTAWCWGWNNNGQLGDNNAGTDSHIPVAVSGGHEWNSLSFGDGDRHVCGIKSDKTAWCWGWNSNGQLGDGNTGTDSSIPVAVSGGGTWKFIMTSDKTTCGIKTDDSLWCWGDNNQGQLGDGTTTDRNIPVEIAAGSKWKKVEGGEYNSCGIKDNNSIWCWGDNWKGQLGDGNASTDSYVPIPISGGGIWQNLEGGEYYFCAIKADETLWCWGDDDKGSLGDSMPLADVDTPVTVSGGGAWKDISAGALNACGIKSDDSLWCWGWNDRGQLGDGNSPTDTSSPVPVSGGGSWSAVSSRYRHSCAIKSDNTVWCWGSNNYGQLGDSTTVDKNVPTLISGGYSWKN